MTTPTPTPTPASPEVGRGRTLPTSQTTHIAATVLTGLSAGFFYSYESSVTRGLAEVDDLTYVHAFQSINETVQNPLFGLVFFGSLPALVLAIVLHRELIWSPKRMLLTLAPVLYVLGMAITVSGNVPLNNDLADVDATTVAVATEARDGFEDDWNRLNGFRTIAFVGSFAAVAAALPLADRASRK